MLLQNQHPTSSSNNYQGRMNNGVDSGYLLTVWRSGGVLCWSYCYRSSIWYTYLVWSQLWVPSWKVGGVTQVWPSRIMRMMPLHQEIVVVGSCIIWGTSIGGTLMTRPSQIRWLYIQFVLQLMKMKNFVLWGP